MKDSYYYIATILSLIIIGFIASILDSVYLMLDFVGVVGVIYISYFQPSVFYLTSWKNYENDRANILKKHGGDESKLYKKNTKLIISSYIQFLVGVL